jgi:hypothetical protein
MPKSFSEEDAKFIQERINVCADVLQMIENTIRCGLEPSARVQCIVQLYCADSVTYDKDDT